VLKLFKQYKYLVLCWRSIVIGKKVSLFWPIVYISERLLVSGSWNVVGGRRASSSLSVSQSLRQSTAADRQHHWTRRRYWFVVKTALH